MEDDTEWLLNILWTNEAHFALIRNRSPQNCLMWTKESPHALVEKRLHDQRWQCYVVSQLLSSLVLFSFEEMSGDRFQTVSVTSGRHAALLKNKIILYLQERQVFHSITFVRKERLNTSLRLSRQSWGFHLERYVSESFFAVRMAFKVYRSYSLRILVMDLREVICVQRSDYVIGPDEWCCTPSCFRDPWNAHQCCAGCFSALEWLYLHGMGITLKNWNI